MHLINGEEVLVFLGYTMREPPIVVQVLRSFFVCWAILVGGVDCLLSRFYRLYCFPWSSHSVVRRNIDTPGNFNRRVIISCFIFRLDLCLLPPHLECIVFISFRTTFIHFHFVPTPTHKSDNHATQTHEEEGRWPSRWSPETERRAQPDWKRRDQQLGTYCTLCERFDCFLFLSRLGQTI